MYCPVRLGPQRTLRAIEVSPMPCECHVTVGSALQRERRVRMWCVHNTGLAGIAGTNHTVSGAHQQVFVVSLYTRSLIAEPIR